MRQGLTVNVIAIWPVPVAARSKTCCECFVSSGRSLCDEIVTRPGESTRLCRVICRNIKNESAMARVGP